MSGGLNAFMQGPGNVEVGFKENLDGKFDFLKHFQLLKFRFAGTIHVQYKPSNSGVYKLNIKFGEIPVVGSPFTINVN